MNRNTWLAASLLAVFATGAAHGQYVVDRTLVPIVQPAPVVVQSAPIVVQRPTIVTQPAPVIVHRPPVTTSQTVWYSATAADVAPSLTVVPSGEPVLGPAMVAQPVFAASPVLVGAAPTVVYRPIVPVPTYYLGRGMVGQPKIYVPGQPVRNAFRYVSP